MTQSESVGRDDFLTVREVAELLKLNQQTIRNWIDQGKLRAVRVGARRVRVRRRDLDEMLAPGRRGAAAGAEHRRQLSHAEMRSELGNAMHDALSELGGGSNAELATALERVATTARALAKALRTG